MLSGQPVKVSGVIVYNFVAPMSPNGLGFDLAYAAATREFREYLDPKSLAAQLPRDWTDERAVLEGLTFVEPTQEPSKVGNTSSMTEPIRDPNKFTIRGDSSGTYRRGKLTQGSLARVRQLREEIGARFDAEPRRQWAYNLGGALGEFVGEIEDVNATRLNIEQLAQLVASSPLSADSHYLSELRRFIEAARTSEFGAEDRQRLTMLANNLKGFKY